MTLGLLVEILVHLFISLFLENFLFLVHQINVVSRALHKGFGVVVMATVMKTQLVKAEVYCAYRLLLSLSAGLAKVVY